jgi:hypothetical protein
MNISINLIATDLLKSNPINQTCFIKGAPLSDSQTIITNKKSPPMVFIGMNELGRFTQPELNSLYATFSQEEVLSSIGTANSAQQFQVTGSKYVIGNCKNPDQMGTASLTVSCTGEQKFEEIEKLAQKKAQIQNYSSVKTPNFYHTLRRS